MLEQRPSPRSCGFDRTPLFVLDKFPGSNPPLPVSQKVLILARPHPVAAGHSV